MIYLVWERQIKRTYYILDQDTETLKHLAGLSP